VTETEVVHLGMQALLMAAKVAAPILLASLTVGLAVSLFQSITQLQEMSLTFVPKLAAISLVLLIGGHWMLNQLVGYVDNLWTHAAVLAGG
jgi:flagellar biosynthetic protein FliQ